MDATMERTGKPRRRMRQENPVALKAAMDEWYIGLDAEMKGKVDVLVKFLIDNRHLANENCNFGRDAALQVIGAGIAVKMGWRRGR